MNKLARSPGTQGSWRRRGATIGALAVTLALTGPAHASPAAMSLTDPAPSLAAASAGFPEIVVLSNRADLVSGGDALVEVKLPKPTDADEVRVTLNGDDVTDQFELRQNGRYLGLVTGLIKGDNELAAQVTKGGGQRAATLTVTNHPKQGPIISGPQVEPYICETELFGLGPSSPPTCQAPTRYEYFLQAGRQRRDRPVRGLRPRLPTSRFADRDHHYRSGQDSSVHRAARARRDQPRCV